MSSHYSDTQEYFIDWDKKYKMGNGKPQNVFAADLSMTNVYEKLYYKGYDLSIEGHSSSLKKRTCNFHYSLSNLQDVQNLHKILFKNFIS